MKFGIALRSMGPQSTRQTIVECTRSAEALGFSDVWVQDHIAIAPDDAEGSNGRYLDPLATLAFLAGATERIGLGTGVLILPYRASLPTAKWVATVQELSDDRLLLGVGAGWLRSEFAALGIERSSRGSMTNDTLEFIAKCFANDQVEANGQPFLFRPRPTRPPIYVGGSPPHALERAARYADGWMPMGADPESLKEPILRLRELFQRRARPEPAVVLLTSFSLDDPSRIADQTRAFANVGVTHIVHGGRYHDAGDFRHKAEILAEHALPAAAAL